MRQVDRCRRAGAGVKTTGRLTDLDGRIDPLMPPGRYQVPTMRRLAFGQGDVTRKGRSVGGAPGTDEGPDGPAEAQRRDWHRAHDPGERSATPPDELPGGLPEPRTPRRSRIPATGGRTASLARHPGACCGFGGARRGGVECDAPSDRLAAPESGSTHGRDHPAQRAPAPHRGQVGRRVRRDLRDRQPRHRGGRRAGPQRQRGRRPGRRGGGQGGPAGWAAWSAEERSALMREAAAAIRAKSSELLPLVIAETGATATVGSRMQVPVAADRFERYARDPRAVLQTPLAPPARAGDAAGTGRDHRRHGQPPAARRGGLHHVVQLPHGQHGGQGGPRAGRRQHRRRQAGAAGPARHRGARAHPQRRRLPPGRGQPGQRQRSGLLRRAWWTPTRSTASASPARPRSA